MPAPQVDAFKELLREHNSVLEHLEVDGCCMSQDAEFYLTLNRHRLRWLLDTEERPTLSANQCEAVLLVHHNDHRIVFCVLSRYAELVASMARRLLTSPPVTKMTKT